MKYRAYKIIIASLLFLIMDILKPFGYSLTVEFSFLGIIFFALNLPLVPAAIAAIITGYVFDCVSTFGVPLHCIEFPLLVLLAHYVLHHVRRRAIKIIIFFVMLMIHMLLRLPVAGTAPIFGIMYCLQSALVYLLITHILKQWITPLSAESTSPAF
jgi:hypothetical protein